MDSKEVERALETLGRDWETYKETNDAKLAKLAEGGGVAEFLEKMEKVDAAITEVVKLNESFGIEQKALEERLAEAEARYEMGGPQTDELKQAAQAKQHLKLFDAALRSRSYNSEPSRELFQYVNSTPELKAVDTLTGAAGGFAVPEIISTDISAQERLLSPVRGMVKVVTVGSSDYKELVDIGGEAFGWVGEGDTRSETGTAVLRERAPTMGIIYSYPKASEESLQDIFFSVQNWLTQNTAIAFAAGEGQAVISGNGTNKPTGLLNTAPVTTDDTASPARSAEALEYVALDTASPTTAIDPDTLLDIIYLLRAGYRNGAQWAMNSGVQGTVRKIKQNSEYIWAPGLVAGQPPALLGYPVATWEDLDSLAAVGNLPILYGNFARGYVLVDRAGLRMTIDEITTPGQTKFYIRRREGGIILDNNAIKVGKWSSS